MISQALIIVFFNTKLDFICDYCLQTAIFLAKRNIVIVFLWPESKSLKEIIINKIKNKKNLPIVWKKRNIIFYQPIHFIPFRRYKFIDNINLFINIILIQIINLFLTINKHVVMKIAWIYDFEYYLATNTLINYLKIYDCVDYLASVDKVENKLIIKKEKSFINKVNLIFTNSSALFQLKKDQHSKVFKVPQGFNSNIFLKTKKQKKPIELKNIPSPKIGFIGNIDHRLDFKLISQLIIKNSQWSFIFIGPIYRNPIQAKVINLDKKLKMLRQLKNVFFLKKIAKRKVPAFIDNLDLGFIPYDLSQEFCRYSYPMKIFEFFARGKPVISTPIESLIPLEPYVKIAKDAKEFEKEIKSILKNSWPKEYIKKQKELAQANSWENKIKKMSQILKKEFPKNFND